MKTKKSLWSASAPGSSAWTRTISSLSLTLSQPEPPPSEDNSKEVIFSHVWLLQNRAKRIFLECFSALGFSLASRQTFFYLNVLIFLFRYILHWICFTGTNGQINRPTARICCCCRHTAASERMFYAKTGLVPWQHSTPELCRHQSCRHAQLGSAEPGEER